MRRSQSAATPTHSPMDGQRKGGKGGDQPIEDLATLFRTDVPAHPLDVVLGRPTKNSITAKVLAYTDREGIIQYGPKAGAPTGEDGRLRVEGG